ncbi:L-threonylcarbamoyladenylate synthase [Candidatus Palauibacter sp.]|uniref:L-threonylcarbamoyladenylate synthase n=1 Tax=Candidatus Palauibacter sp. TaxID=3101350 RepID=UPI003B0167B0
MIDIASDALRWYEWGGAGTGSEASEAAVERGPGRPLAAGVDALERAVALLDAGGVVAHPTSTVYGLGGRPARGVDERISALKRRPPGPLIRLAASREALHEALPGVRWSGAARRLADAFWPGPLTLVLDDGSEAGIALRVDPHPVVRRLLERAGGLMTSTSLNETGRPPARTRREARDALASMRPQVGPIGWLDAGDLEASPPSTLVRMRGETVEVLREGALSALEMEQFLRGSDRRGAPG